MQSKPGLLDDGQVSYASKMLYVDFSLLKCKPLWREAVSDVDVVEQSACMGTSLYCTQCAAAQPSQH